MLEKARLVLLILVLMVSTTSSFKWRQRPQHSWSSPPFRTSFTPSSFISSSASSSSFTPSHSPSSSLERMRQRLNIAIQMSQMSPRYKDRVRNMCKVEPILLRLQPPARFSDACGATLVHTFGCRGQCSSYSSIDPRNTTNIVHSCRCCQPVSTMMTMALLPCTSLPSIRVPVKKVLKCSCRPCYQDDTTVSDVIKLRDLLDSRTGDGPFTLG